MMCEWLERAVGQGRFYFCLLHFHLVLPLLKWEILYHCVPCRSESVATYPLSQPFWLGFVPFLKPSSHVTIEAEVALGASLSQIILIHPAFSGTSTMRAFSWVTLFGTPQSAQEISSGCSLIGLILKLKFQYFGHLMGRTDSFEKTLMLRKIEGRGKGDDRGWNGWMASLTQWIWVWVNLWSWWWTGRPGVLRFTGSQRVGHNGATELNWVCSVFGGTDLWILIPSWFIQNNISRYT